MAVHNYRVVTKKENYILAQCHLKKGALICVCVCMHMGVQLLIKSFCNFLILCHKQ